MSCYHPKLAYIYKISDNKQKLKFLKGYYNNIDEAKRIHRDLILVPCGKCIGCKLEYSKHWASRCVLEASNYDNNYFITLTYDDDHLPVDNKVSKREIQLFMKRLRKYLGENVKYFCCGEYGSKGNRPHYHLILFNANFTDLQLYSKAKIGYYYSSDTLSKCWKKGFSLIGECSLASCEYVAKYVLKKVGSDDSFLLMSKGLGKSYCLNNLDDLIKNKKIVFNFSENNKFAYLPRYFKNIIEDLSPGFKEALNIDNSLAIDLKNNNLKHLYGVDSLDEILNIKEKNINYKLFERRILK